MESDEVLTGEESEALRDSAATDDASPSADAGGVRALDPDHWDRVFKDRAPALESIAERMVSRFKLSGRNYFRQTIEVSTEQPRVVRWGYYVRKLPIPASLHELEIQPLGLRGVMSMNSQFIYTLVDMFFGGDGNAERPPDFAEFTSMEERMVRRFVETLAADMEESWRPLVDLKFVIGKSEANPLFLSIAKDSDSLSITPFTFQIGDRELQLDIALPSALIEPMQFVSKGAGASGGRVVGWRHQIQEDVQDAEVVLRGVIAQTEISLRDLTTAKPGDVIPIEAPGAVMLMAGEQPVMEGSFGIIKEANAVQVIRRVNPDRPGERNG
ncbi:MAG: hypothetical protein HKN56_08370 [Gammaproteobacteria bacterium]|nr:hypothetical protein [Gammaproteobacteria bacterium]